MLQQLSTGIETENLVAREVEKLGLRSNKPIPDVGIDLVVTSPLKPRISINIQVKGRGANQKNKKYRWFQIRTTKKQRQEAVESGFPINEAWRIKVKKANLFILVSLKYQECWIFDQKGIQEVIVTCASRYSKRKDNQQGIQAEINLDLVIGGKPLNEVYMDHLNNWEIISDYFK